MPIGILGSLVICTILYILVSGLLTGVVSYTTLNVPDPVAVGIDHTGVRWGSVLVKLGAIAGLGSVMLVMLLGQSRVFFSMSRDGLLPQWAGAVHPRFRTPWISSITVGIFVAIFASPDSDRHSRRTGQHRHAAGVCDRMRGRVDFARAPARVASSVQNAVGAVRAHHGDSGRLGS